MSCPDLDIEKIAGDDDRSMPAIAISFTITVTNSGDGRCLRRCGHRRAAGRASSGRETSADCAITTGTLTCTYDEMLAGDDETVTITGTDRPSDCGVVENTATVDASNLPATGAVELRR